MAGCWGKIFPTGRFFFDKLRLKVGQIYPEELDNAARNSALLVALLSPSYATSEWCSRERSLFQGRLARGASFGECLVAVRVRLTDALPEILRRAQRKDFVVPGREGPWPASSHEWLEVVNQLAAEIKPILQKLRTLAGSVFVGPTLRTHSELRSNLADYLSQQHFRATPDPAALLDDRTATQMALAEATCAVHFIGGATDEALEAVDDSIQYCPGATILFQPFGTKLTAAEELFLAGIPPERYPQRTGPNETELKKFLDDLLTRIRKAAQRASPSIGLVCEPADFPWAERFNAGQLSVDYPRFLQEKLTNTNRIRQWRRMVRESHGLIFYQGRSDEALLERIRRLADEEQSIAVRRWYLDHPDLGAKRDRRPADPVYPEGLHEFLDEVRRRAGGSS